MKVLCYDCFSGISGDMNLGAMIDLGIDSKYLVTELNKLGLDGWKLSVEEDQKHGIKGTKVTVHQTKHQHAHRHLSDIESIISNSNLDTDIKDMSRKIFMKVAEAESKVHGIPVDHVHFHEVGAIDSIIDIVGAAICFRKLSVDEVYVLPVELGGGYTDCEHGRLPVPAPATAEIIKGIPVTSGGADFEATTPTGAAIIAALGTHFSKLPPLKIIKTGYGSGQKNSDALPNMLRVFLAETEARDAGHNAVMLESNIDDMNPEFYEHIAERLFSEGASDVYLTSVIMKRGRPGTVLSVICESGYEEKLSGIIFSETTTLGIRKTNFVKETLSRLSETIETEYGKIRIKRSFLNGRQVSVKPEYEDCRKAAIEKNVPIKEVWLKISTLLNNTDNSGNKN